MQRYSIAAMALLFSAAVIAVVLHAGAPEGRPAAVAEASSAATVGAAEDAAVADAGVEPNPAQSADAGARDAEGNVPPLPASAPKQVRLGVILFRYRGAEGSPKDAPTKAEALAKAERALEEARADFEDAVKFGDVGSTMDAGRIPRGVLERALEYAVFTLEPGKLYPAPLDTPRGYWIVRRLD
jgi:hypothetical protein